MSSTGSTVACPEARRSVIVTAQPTEDDVAIDYHLLSSLSATLDDVVSRIGELSRTADEDDEAAIDLQEIERQLTTASRRLTKVIRRKR